MRRRSFAVLLAVSACVRNDPAPTSSAAGPSGESSSSLPRPHGAPSQTSVLVSSASAAPTSPTPPTKRTYVVAAIGDSLTDPKSHGGKYLDVLRARCPKSTFDSYGVGGNMVNMMRRRFLRDVYGEGTAAERPKYTHVIVLGGIGDILSNLTAKRGKKSITEDLDAMYGLARERGAEPIALTLPPWGTFQDYDPARHQLTIEVNAWIRARASAEPPMRVVDVFPLLSCGDPNALCPDYAFKDRLHWSAKGHEVLGQKLFDEVFGDCG